MLAAKASRPAVIYSKQTGLKMNVLNILSEKMHGFKVLLQTFMSK